MLMIWSRLLFIGEVLLKNRVREHLEPLASIIKYFLNARCLFWSLCF